MWLHYLFPVYSLALCLLDAVNDDQIVNTDRPQEDETAPEEQAEEPAAPTH